MNNNLSRITRRYHNSLGIIHHRRSEKEASEESFDKAIRIVRIALKNHLDKELAVELAQVVQVVGICHELLQSKFTMPTNIFQDQLECRPDNASALLSLQSQILSKLSREKLKTMQTELSQFYDQASDQVLRGWFVVLFMTFRFTDSDPSVAYCSRNRTWRKLHEIVLDPHHSPQLIFTSKWRQEFLGRLLRWKLIPKIKKNRHNSFHSF